MAVESHWDKLPTELQSLIERFAKEATIKEDVEPASSSGGHAYALPKLRDFSEKHEPKFEAYVFECPFDKIKKAREERERLEVAMFGEVVPKPRRQSRRGWR